MAAGAGDASRSTRFGPLPGPRGPECASAGSLSGARPRARALRVVDRVAGPRTPERGVEVGAWRLSLMMYWMLLLSMKQSSVPWHFPSYLEAEGGRTRAAELEESDGPHG